MVAILQKLLAVGRNNALLLLLVHLVRSLLSERKLLRKNKKSFVRLVLRETVRSLMFVATYNFFRKFGSCYARHYFGMSGTSASPSLGLLLQRNDRRSRSTVRACRALELLQPLPLPQVARVAPDLPRQARLPLAGPLLQGTRLLTST